VQSMKPVKIVKLVKGTDNDAASTHFFAEANHLAEFVINSLCMHLKK